MDETVLRSMAKWPDVPDVYGWLALDRRGNWLIKGERIGNSALKDFISRNYQTDQHGCWYFQNGPQRVFVSLAYTPLVVRWEGNGLMDHCGRMFSELERFIDDEGSILIRGECGVALLDDRDLERFADGAKDLPRIAVAEVPERFGFIANPALVQ